MPKAPEPAGPKVPFKLGPGPGAVPRSPPTSHETSLGGPEGPDRDSELEPERVEMCTVQTLQRCALCHGTVRLCTVYCAHPPVTMQIRASAHTCRLMQAQGGTYAAY